MSNIVHLQDCIEGMKQFPDKHFDLAVVDPPYGIGQNRNGGKSIGLRKKWAKSYKKEKYTEKDWDLQIPSEDYFLELRRVSKNQIIWGANYFELPPTKGIIAWDKMCDGTDFSHFELAWSSFDRSARIIRIAIQEESQRRIHPTQKPVKLYEWIFENYAKQSIICGHKHTKEYNHLCDICKNPYKILDTHVGSGSSRIAAHKAGLDFTGYEIDPDYHKAQEKRYLDFTKQLTLNFKD